MKAVSLAAIRQSTCCRQQAEDDRIIDNSTNGNLIFDPDGRGPLAGTVFAVLPTGLALTASSIVVADSFLFARTGS